MGWHQCNTTQKNTNTPDTHKQQQFHGCQPSPGRQPACTSLYALYAADAKDEPLATHADDPFQCWQHRAYAKVEPLATSVLCERCVSSDHHLRHHLIISSSPHMSFVAHALAQGEDDTHPFELNGFCSPPHLARWERGFLRHLGVRRADCQFAENQRPYPDHSTQRPTGCWTSRSLFPSRGTSA
jgi:hypothetical protein